MARYSVEILDSSLNFKAIAQNLAPIDREGNFLEWTKRLSDWGKCRFRLGTEDPLLTTEGDILKPFQNHVRIKRDGVKVWQGVIINNPSRNKRYIEVEAYTYLYLLSRVLVKHDAADGKGAENYRTVKSGTIASNLTTFATECKADMGAPLSNLTVGTIDNPNFPAGFTNALGTALTGAWTFSDNFLLKFDFRDLLYVLTAFGMYSNFDFEVTDDMVLNFKQFIGNRQPELKFEYGEFGSVEDYDVPRDGDNMATVLVGVAADNQSNILTEHLHANAAITTYGKIFGVAAYADAKDRNVLRQRLSEELRLTDHPDEEVNITLNQRAYPLGQYGIGDIVTIRINHNVISFDQQRRIVGLNVKVHNTGKETIRIMTNKPREGQ